MTTKYHYRLPLSITLCLQYKTRRSVALLVSEFLRQIHIVAGT